MSISWAQVQSRMGGRWAVSLAAYLLSAPFWILGFVLNEDITYESWESALSVIVVSTIGHLGLGLVFLVAHLTVLRNRRKTPAAFWLAVIVWGLSGATRALLLVVGLALFDLENTIPNAQRVIFSALIGIVGFAVLSYALDAIDRFRAVRAEVLEVLLQGEEQLSAHRAAVQSMQDALVARVDKRLKKSHDATIHALDQLEQSLTSSPQALPALEELRNLSDSTWQRISQDLWNSAPPLSPKIRIRELLNLLASSRPFSLLHLVLVGFFLFALLYSRVFDPLVGAALVGLWMAGALSIGALGNWLLPPLQKYTVPTFVVLVAVFLFSSIPLLLLAETWGAAADRPWRVLSAHALFVLVVLGTSLLSSVPTARERILAGLKQSLDTTTLEKLHVESQLKVLSHKMASKLHGDVRGNFLAVVMKLQDHIMAGDTATAAREVQALRSILQEPQDLSPVTVDSRSDIEKFVENWKALVDIALDQPLSTVPDQYLSVVHTIVVNAVNNAVRHGKASWIRIGFTSEPHALLVTVQNNGEPQQGTRAGLGTAQLELYAPDKWSLLRNSRGMTQLLVRLEESLLPAESPAR
jgi:signal transduction histidine kinase